MFLPCINYDVAQQALQSAMEMLSPYEENVSYLTNEVERLDEEINAATSIVNLIERADIRQKLLSDCQPYSDFYASLLGGSEILDKHRQFLNTLESRRARFNELLAHSKKATALLKSDIADLETLQKTTFRHYLTYFSVPSNGWSFFIFRSSNRLTQMVHERA